MTHAFEKEAPIEMPTHSFESPPLNLSPWLRDIDPAFQVKRVV